MYLKAGNFHAELGDLIGEEAVTRSPRLDSWNFTFAPSEETDVVSIQTSNARSSWKRPTSTTRAGVVRKVPARLRADAHVARCGAAGHLFPTVELIVRSTAKDIRDSRGIRSSSFDVAKLLYCLVTATSSDADPLPRAQSVGPHRRRESRGSLHRISRGRGSLSGT